MKKDCHVEMRFRRKNYCSPSCVLIELTGLVHENTGRRNPERRLVRPNDASEAVEYKFQINILRVTRNTH